MYVHILSKLKLKHKLFSRIKVTVRSTTQSTPEMAVKTEAPELALQPSQAPDKHSSSVESTAETALQPSLVKHENTTSHVKL